MSSTVNIGTLEGLLRWKADSTELDKSLDQVAKKANVSRAQLNAYNREIASINQIYKKVAASIDPAIAAEQKLEKAHSAFSNALKIGLIDHQRYNTLLDQAKQKYSETESPLKSLIESVIKLTGSLGPAGAGAHEVAEGLGGLAGKAGSLGEMIAGLGPLLPIVLGLAAALAAVGVAFEAFEFIKGAVEEGLKLQEVIERLNSSLKNTGSYSGLSSHEIIELAGSYALLTGRTKEEEIEAALTLTRFKNLTENVYPKALDAVNAYAKSLGITAAEAAKKLGPLLDGNTRSLRAAKEAGVDLTTGQQAMLKSMVDSGDIAGYQAKLFDILREKVGLAAGAHETLGIQAGRVKFVFSELKEGIASELIPSLEYLSHDIFGSIDDWKQASKSASDFGHTVGDFLRGQIYGVIVIIHDVEAAVGQIFIWMDEAVAKVALSLAELFSALNLDSAANVMLSVVTRANLAIAATTAEMYKNKKASDAAIDSWFAHKQALEGDTDAAKKHGSAQDEVGTKQKKLNDLMGEADRIVRAYTDKLADLTKKLIDQGMAQGRLLSAAESGLDIYARELLTQERRNAILVVTNQLEKEHRTEVEKLQDLENKARGEGRAADAEKIRASIEKSNIAFDRQIKVEGDLAAQNFDLKHSTDLVLDSSKLTFDFTTKQIEIQAQFIDELTGTTVASRENAIQIDIQRRVLESLKHTQEDLSASITETVRREHDFTNSMHDALEVAKALASLNNQATLQTAVSNIDTSQSKYLQQIEAQYLQIIANIGRGSIDEGQRIIDATQTALDTFGIHIGNLSDLIKKHLQDIQDTEISKTVAGASKTPFDLYKEERDRIEQYISGSTQRTTQQIKDAQAYIEHLDSSYWSGQIGEWSSALGNIANLFGGFLGKIAGAISQALKSVQSAYNSGNQIGGLLNNAGIGGAGLGSTLGLIGAEVQIFYEVYSLVDQMIKTQNAHKYGTSTQLSMIGGDWSSPTYFNEIGRQMSMALRNTLQSVLDSIHGVLADLPQITIRARADGKKFAAYVAGVFVGEFDSAQEAIEQGIASALSGATFANISAEMKRVLEASIGKTLTELEANIKTANEAIADRLGDLGNSFLENIDKYLQRIEAERKLGLSTEATTQAMMRSIEAYKNQILGIDTTASDRLAALRSLSDGMKEASGSIEAELQKRIDDVLAQIAALENQARHPNARVGGDGGSVGGGGDLGGGFNEQGGGPLPASPEDEALRHLREVLRQYTDELNKIPKALTDQQISMGIFDTLYQYLQKSPKYAAEAAKWAKVKVDIEFAQIKLQLELLGKWEEFQGMFNDAYNAALAAAGKTSHAGGGKGNDKQSVQSFIDDRRLQLQLNQMDQFHQQLAQIAKDYEAQLKAAGKDKKLREELLALQAQETALAIAAHKKDVADRFGQLVSPNDVFAQAIKPFEDMKKEVVDAGYGAARTATMIGRLTAAEKEAIEKLSMTQFSSLVGDLSNIIADSKTNTEQHLLHNDLLRAQEIINYQIKMIELRNEYVLLKAKGDLTKSEIDLLDKAFGWIDQNANILPGGKDWIPSFESVTTAADSISSAASNLNSASDELKTAIQSLTDYQKSLHTDSSLGLVNSREALDNSKSIYEAIVAKALTGDVSAIKEFKDDAENYRKNILAFSPSSALVSNVLQGIDATIDKIKALPSVKAALTPDGQAVVANLGYVTNGISSVDRTAQAINDNLKQTPTAISDAMNFTTLSQAQAAAMAQSKNAEALSTLSEQFKGLASNILAFRTEARQNSDELYIQFKHAADTLDIVAINTRPRHQRAGVGG